MELLMVAAFFGYLYYLRNYADLRSRSEKEEGNLKEGIDLYRGNQIHAAFDYFDQRIKVRPNSAVAYLYRARCYKELGYTEAAMTDLNLGMTYDESVFGLHLEKGKLLFGREAYEKALPVFGKAIFNAGEQDPESYYWRGLTWQHLNREEEAKKDFEKEAIILESRKKQEMIPGKPKNPFFDRRLVANSVLVICTSIILVLAVKKAESIHLPYLLAAFAAISIGFVEPRKGWILALLQCMLVIAGYYLFTSIPENGGKREVENFSLYGSIVLTFAGSFLGAFLKTAINQG